MSQYIIIIMISLRGTAILNTLLNVSYNEHTVQEGSLLNFMSKYLK